jgi:DNA-directed RNA polymerase specialized sigma subunit
MKFKLTQEWIHESTFLGKKTSKKLYEKGHIFEPENEIYKIIDHTGEIIELDESQMKSFDIFEEFKEESDDFEIIIEEIPEDDDILVRNWRIQLDVKTTKLKLREVEKIINEMVKPIL